MNTRLDMDVRGGTVVWDAFRPVVVIAGDGIWTDLLSALVSRSGSSPIVVLRPDDLFVEGVALRPEVVVMGSPLAPAELVRITALVRDRAPGTPVIAALDEDAPADLAGDLGVIGATAVPLDHDLGRLLDAVARCSGLQILESHRGILLVPVLLQGGHSQHAAIAVDVSEGGLCIEDADTFLLASVAQVQFHLPGMMAPIVSPAEITWTQERQRGRARAGLRFTGLDPLDRAAIRVYLDGEGLAADGGDPLALN